MAIQKRYVKLEIRYLKKVCKEVQEGQHRASRTTD